MKIIKRDRVKRMTKIDFMDKDGNVTDTVLIPFITPLIEGDFDHRGVLRILGSKNETSKAK